MLVTKKLLKEFLIDFICQRFGSAPLFPPETLAVPIVKDYWSVDEL